MEQTQNKPTRECNSFKRKLGNTTYNVTVHFNENSTGTLEYNEFIVQDHLSFVMFCGSFIIQQKVPVRYFFMKKL